MNTVLSGLGHIEGASRCRPIDSHHRWRTIVIWFGQLVQQGTSGVLSGPNLHAGNFRFLRWGCLSGIWRSGVLLNNGGSQRFRGILSLSIPDHDAALAVDCIVILTKITWREHGSLFDILFRGSRRSRLFYFPLWRGIQ